MTTISWSNSFFTDTTVAMLIKHNNYTKLERTENYNHSLELTVICGMYMGIIKIREFKQHSHEQMSAPDCQATCRTLPVSTSFHPKSKSSFFYWCSSVTVNQHWHSHRSLQFFFKQKSSVFHTRISFFGGVHMDWLFCLWPSLHAILWSSTHEA